MSIKNFLVITKHITEMVRPRRLKLLKQPFKFMHDYMFATQKTIVYTKTPKAKFTIQPNNFWPIHEILLRDDYHMYVIKPGDIVVDIGANCGVFSVLAAKKRATVFAIEPEPSNIDMLIKNIKDNKLKVNIYSGCISDHNGFEKLERSEQGGSHSVIHHSGTIKVASVTLATFFKIHNIEKVDFLKMDVEGAEYKILYAFNDFSMIQRIHMEYHDIKNHSGEQLVQFLENKGYTVERVPAYFTNHGYIYAYR